MTTVAILGWAAAATALAALVACRRSGARRLELAAQAAHELAAPLGAARLAVHSLSREGAPPERVAALDRELARAGRAVEDLAVARAGERATGRAEEVAAERLVRDAGAAWRPVAQALGAQLRVDVDGGLGTVRGDRVRLGQAIDNLIANALEHGGRTVVLRGRASLRGVRIEVADDGPGLPAPVDRLVRRARAGRGRGRGLAIAADVVERHGGRVSAAPSARGARVAVELPAIRAPLAAHAAADDPATARTIRSTAGTAEGGSARAVGAPARPSPDPPVPAAA